MASARKRRPLADNKVPGGIVNARDAKKEQAPLEDQKVPRGDATNVRATTAQAPRECTDARREKVTC